MKRTGIVIVAMISIILVLSVVQMSVGNSLSTGGLQLSMIQSQIQTYQKDNAILKEKVLAASSLTNISEKAGKIGFASSTTKVLVISQNQPPIAYKQ